MRLAHQRSPIARELAVALVVAVAGCQALPPSTPSGSSTAPIRVVRVSMPPPDPSGLEPGLGWAEIYDVELPADAFGLNPSPSPFGATGPGRAGHPGHFPGQAIMADVAEIDGGLLAVGYVGDPWTAIAWSSVDGFDWRLEPIEQDDPSFAVAVAQAQGSVVAVGRHGTVAAAWIRNLDGTWGRAIVHPGPGGDAERMTRIARFGDRWIAGGSAGPELGDRHARFWTSDDGRSWIPVADDRSFAGAEVVAIHERPDGLIAMGRLGTGQRGTGTIAWQSADGATWQRIDDPALRGGLVVAVAWSEETGFVAVGSDLDERAAAVWLSTDWLTWEQAPMEESRLNHGHKIRMTDAIPTPGGFVAVGNEVGVQFGTGDSWLSLDGRTWARSPRQPSLGQGELLALTLSDRYVVAVGSQGAPDNYVPTAWLSPIPGH